MIENHIVTSNWYKYQCCFGDWIFFIYILVKKRDEKTKKRKMFERIGISLFSVLRLWHFTVISTRTPRLRLSLALPPTPHSHYLFFIQPTSIFFSLHINAYGYAYSPRRRSTTSPPRPLQAISSQPPHRESLHRRRHRPRYHHRRLWRSHRPFRPRRWSFRRKRLFFYCSHRWNRWSRSWRYLDGTRRVRLLINIGFNLGGFRGFLECYIYMLGILRRRVKRIIIWENCGESKKKSLQFPILVIIINLFSISTFSFFLHSHSNHIPFLYSLLIVFSFIQNYCNPQNGWNIRIHF